ELPAVQGHELHRPRRSRRRPCREDRGATALGASDRGVPLDQAALIEPLSVAHHAYVRSQAQSGQVAIVRGAGPIGLLTAAVLKAEGLTVYISELSEARKSMALSTGVADEVFDPRDGDVAEAVRERTGGRGADVGFECSSVPVVLDMLLDAVRPGGVIVNVSIWGHKPEVD